MDDELKHYLQAIIEPQANWIVGLEEQAKEESIPIMDPLGISFLMQLIRIHKPKTILEIGTAIGYSALRMSQAYPKTSIITIERDKKRYEQAIHNIKMLDKQENIHVIFGDALEKISEMPANSSFDLIFIDAAKGQYKRFFELTTHFLAENGIIISDNVLFRGYVANPNLTDQKRFKKIAGSIREYNDWLMKHPNFITTIVPVGDGVAISKKK
ncbi:O-methyltransferase [Virgibacillus byunsanensis]|uniref:tRNA 5-hydroxyuridine methyltransferase n=1 Tax=Virgibacillus byunsanensis TaxID=570945 RepID=A0ABW3LKH1_9BACI